jgi:hypothetical protein
MVIAGLLVRPPSPLLLLVLRLALLPPLLPAPREGGMV